MPMYSISFDDVAFRSFVFSMPMYSISFDDVAFRSFVFSMPMYSISFDGVAFRSFMSSPCLCIPFHLMVLHFDRLCLLHAISCMACLLFFELDFTPLIPSSQTNSCFQMAISEALVIPLRWPLPFGHKGLPDLGVLREQ